MDSLLRYKIDISKIDQINAHIEAHQRMIAWYEEWIELNEHWDYIDERIGFLNGQLAEYLIASEFAKEGVRTYGLECKESYNNPKQPLGEKNEHRPLD